jgi:hypothetical protein
VLLDEPLQLQAHRNVEVFLRPTGDTSWIHIEGTLSPAAPMLEPGAAAAPDSAENRSFAFAARRGQQRRVFLSALPAGRYQLRFDLSWQQPTQPAGAEVRFRQGVAHAAPLVVVILGLGAAPLVLALYQLLWESRRWHDSNV